ncbi:redox-sensing transcriptional repressor Rex [Spirochaetia bacterium]|nr:redox-sensing transcriptional repressor Rex [Spirochaetia bacterium]
MTDQIPSPAKERLLHLMRVLEQRKGVSVTSAEVEALTGWASHTIRKDISWLGGDFGSSNGYHGEALVPAIKAALGLERRRRFCVVGLGRLGSAFLNFPAADLGEFELAAGFDSNVNRVEILKSPAPLYPAYKMAEVIGRFAIETALLCVPAAAAQAAAEKLAAAGIRGILNYAPVALSLPPELAVRNVFVLDELRSLAVKMSNGVYI